MIKKQMVWPAGLAAIIYTEDGQGKRVSVGELSNFHTKLVESKVVIATSPAGVLATIEALQKALRCIRGEES